MKEKTAGCFGVKWQALAALALCWSFTVLHGAEPPVAAERYISFFQKIQEGEKAESAGEREGAIQSYRAARDLLIKIQNENPEWRRAMVEHRLAGVERKLFAQEKLMADEVRYKKEMTRIEEEGTATSVHHPVVQELASNPAGVGRFDLAVPTQAAPSTVADGSSTPREPLPENQNRRRNRLLQERLAAGSASSGDAQAQKAVRDSYEEAITVLNNELKIAQARITELEQNLTLVKGGDYLSLMKENQQLRDTVSLAEAKVALLAQSEHDAIESLVSELEQVKYQLSLTQAKLDQAIQ